MLTSCNSQILPDFSFLQGLFDVFPFASDDIEARSEIWTFIAGLSVHVQESLMSSSTLHQYVSVFVTKSEMIEDELLDHQLEHCRAGAKLCARTTALRKIISILSQWTISKDSIEGNVTRDNLVNEGTVERLLERCHKYTDPRSIILGVLAGFDLLFVVLLRGRFCGVLAGWCSSL
ncbi:hypothetical protein U1Q18_032916 [Sarracenia purpurea var. burkii]